MILEVFDQVRVHVVFEYPLVICFIFDDGIVLLLGIVMEQLENRLRFLVVHRAGLGRAEGVEHGMGGRVDVGLQVIGGQVTGQPIDCGAVQLPEAADQGDLVDRIEQAVLRLVGQSVFRAAQFRRVRVVLGALVVLRVDPVDQVAGEIPCLLFTDLRLLIEAEVDPGSLILLFRGEVRLLEQVLEQKLDLKESLVVRLLLGLPDVCLS